MLCARSLRSAVDLQQIQILAQQLATASIYLARSASETAERSPPSRGQTAQSTAAPPPPDVEAWFRDLHPRVYAYIRYRVANLQEAEDLTSEIMERALVHLDTYDVRKGAFSTWLFRIAHNTFVNYAKQQQRQSQYEVDLGEGFEDLATDEPSPEQAAVRQEEIARLLVCVRTLSPRQQDILAMRFAGRLTNREIAGILKMNERTVSVTILRALRTLRRKLQAHLDASPGRSMQGRVEQQTVSQTTGGG
jgi:RNA polymerase sigma factor (sigma-70 family)